MSISHPCQHGIRQSQDALPVDPRKEEAVRWQDGSYVDDNGPIWAFGEGDTVNAQLTFPVALGVPDSHSPASWLVGAGAKHRGGSQGVWMVTKACGRYICNTGTTFKINLRCHFKTKFLYKNI